MVADRIETVSPRQEIEHHSTVGELWDRVYSQRVDVRGMLETIERGEKELKKKKRQREFESESSSCSEYGGGGSDLSSSSCIPTPNVSQSQSFREKGIHDPLTGNRLKKKKKIRYRPTRPSKLSLQDITLTNFVVYIRHHLVKNYIENSSSSSSSSRLFTPPPSSQNSFLSRNNDFDNDDDDDDVQPREEWCLPFEIEGLRNSSKHLEVFARRLSLERDRKEREKKKLERDKRKRDGGADLSTVIVGSNYEEKRASGESVWINSRGRGEEEGKVRQRVTVGNSKLVKMMMLRPPSNSLMKSASRRRERGGVEEQEEEVEEDFDRELEGKKLDKEVKRCWEDAIRLMGKNGMIVEYVPNRDQEEPEEEDDDDDDDEKAFNSINRSSGGLPDEPLYTTRPPRPTTPARQFATKGNDTPRASSTRNLRNRSFPSTTSTLSSSTTTIHQPRQRYQLVTALSIAPLLLEHIREISRSLVASGGSSSSRSRPTMTEVDVRLALYRDDRWSAVAKYGEVVKRSLELLEEREEIVSSGKGFSLA